ncbi:MaoC/PaaZ C-terminal domain-containing protein [Streptomyces sp. NPDC055239]
MSRQVTVGTELPPLELPEISRTTLALFAGASGDLHPVHIDLDAARDAGFDDVFAHGMLSMAYLGRLLTGWTEQSRIRGYGVRFTAMTPVRSRPTCRGLITAVQETDGEHIATIAVTVTLADGTTTLRGEATIAL